MTRFYWGRRRGNCRAKAGVFAAIRMTNGNERRQEQKQVRRLRLRITIQKVRWVLAEVMGACRADLQS
jgi:hypothetical protein